MYLVMYGKYLYNSAGLQASAGCWDCCGYFDDLGYDGLFNGIHEEAAGVTGGLAGFLLGFRRKRFFAEVSFVLAKDFPIGCFLLGSVVFLELLKLPFVSSRESGY